MKLIPTAALLCLSFQQINPVCVGEPLPRYYPSPEDFRLMQYELCQESGLNRREREFCEERFGG